MLASMLLALPFTYAQSTSAETASPNRTIIGVSTTYTVAPTVHTSPPMPPNCSISDDRSGLPVPLNCAEWAPERINFTFPMAGDYWVQSVIDYSGQSPVTNVTKNYIGWQHVNETVDVWLKSPELVEATLLFSQSLVNWEDKSDKEDEGWFLMAFGPYAQRFAPGFEVGDGYYLILARGNSRDCVYAKSEQFSIRSGGTEVDVPPGMSGAGRHSVHAGAMLGVVLAALL